MIMVYRTGSRDGHPFDYKAVPVDEYEDALDDGWLAEPPTPAKKALAAAEAAEDAAEAVTPATREELEEMARELGVKFNSRTKDETLLARLAEATE